MSAVLVGIGGGIFLLLGLAHAVFTLQSKPGGGPMMPTDPDVLAAMSQTGGLGMAPELRSTLYRAWIGFNYSHSLGLVVSGSLLLLHSIRDLGAAGNQGWFITLAFAVPAVYLLLAQQYWFDKPRDAIAMGGLLVWIGMAIELS